MRNAFPAAMASILLCSCAVGPDYGGPPSIALGETKGFLRASGETVVPDPPLGDWWTLLGDPVLDQLEARALAGNPGLAAAQARVGQARAAVRREQAERLPTLAAQATTIQAKVPGLDLQGPPAASTPDPSAGQPNDRLSIYNVGLNANWEIDFAGGRLRRIEGANAEAAAAVATVDDAKVQLTAEVARAYVGLREAELRLQLARQERDLQKQTLDLTFQRYTAGVTALFPVGAANAELELLTSQIAEAQADTAVLKDALSVLIGSPPGGLDDLLATTAPIPLPPASVAVSDPTALIARRPDIRAAERKLAAANARVGVAAAARFPRLSFMGILGLGGADPQDVFDLSNLSTIALPRLQWSLVDFGRTTAAIEQADSARREADAGYRDVVLGALQDAEQSLARFGQHRASVAALAQINRQADTAAGLDQQRYTSGAISRTELNLTLRRQAQARANLNRSLAAMTVSWVALQKSLGLGWRAAPELRHLRPASEGWARPTT